MSRGASFGGGGVVARSLKITRATYGMVAVANAAIVANAMVAMGYSTFVGQMALAALLFASMALVGFAVSADVFSRSGQAVTSLRSIGASKASLSMAVLTSVLAYGAAGSILGAGLGGVMGMGLAGSTAGIQMAFNALLVVVVSAAATAAGVYTGARSAWRS